METCMIKYPNGLSAGLVFMLFGISQVFNNIFYFLFYINKIS